MKKIEHGAEFGTAQSPTCIQALWAARREKRQKRQAHSKSFASSNASLGRASSRKFSLLRRFFFPPFAHGCAPYSLASRTYSPIDSAWDLFPHRRHLPEVAPLSRRRAPPRAPPRSAHCRLRLRLASRGLGGLLQSLSFCWSFTCDGSRCFQPRGNAQKTPLQ